MKAYDIFPMHFLVKIVDFFGLFRQIKDVREDCEKMGKTPFAMVRNVLLLTMMKNMPAAILGLSLVGALAEAAAPIPGGQPPRMTPDQALQILMGNGFMARPYYNGVPDPEVVRQVDSRTRMRAMINAKLNSLVIPKIDQLWDFTMEEAIESLEAAFKKHDPEGVGFQLHINPYVDPGGVPIQNGGAGGGVGGGAVGGGPGGGMAIDPTTGLPIGGGLGEGLGGGAPQIDPTTGLPIGAGVGAGVGGGLPGMGGGLPGVGGGLPGMGGGLPGMGGGGAEGGAAFDSTTVKVRGLKKELVNLTAKQILDIVTMSFDSPIQYIVTDQGIMFLQQKKEYQGTITRVYQLNLSMRSLAMMGIATPQLGNGNNGPGGGGGEFGGGGGEFGGGGGEFGGGGEPGGGFGGGAEPGMGGGMPPIQKATSGGFGSSYRPFSNLNRFAPATSGNQRFNRFTPGYGPSRSRGRQ